DVASPRSFPTRRSSDLVVVTPATASMFPGGTAQLTATPMDSAGNALTGRTVAWSSNATSVATIDANGSVKGVAAGSATITATSRSEEHTSELQSRSDLV